MNLQEELKLLKQRIAELEKQVELEKEFPQEDDIFWFINTFGKPVESTWGESITNRQLIEIGNMFSTKEQVEFAVEKLKVEAELRKFSRPFKEGENNYYLELYLSDKALSIDSDDYFQSQGTFYFDSEKIAMEAIDTVGDWHIKKYIFGVED